MTIVDHISQSGTAAGTGSPKMPAAGRALRIAKRFKPAPEPASASLSWMYPETIDHRERADKIYRYLLDSDSRLASDVELLARTTAWYHEPAASLEMMRVLHLT